MRAQGVSLAFVVVVVYDLESCGGVVGAVPALIPYLETVAWHQDH
jgi:hypothetical protein